MRKFSLIDQRHNSIDYCDLMQSGFTELKIE